MPKAEQFCTVRAYVRLRVFIIIIIIIIICFGCGCDVQSNDTLEL